MNRTDLEIVIDGKIFAVEQKLPDNIEHVTINLISKEENE